MSVIKRLPKTKRARLVAIALLMTPLGVFADELRPFTTDGCSSFPDGTFKQKTLWRDCCVAHDLAYWQGGTYAQRSQSDETLRACVEKMGEPAVGLIMQSGVRASGSPFFPTAFRWGYGWPYPRSYGPLTVDEKQQVLTLTPPSMPVIPLDTTP